MLERHTFKALIGTVIKTEEGLKKLETALNCHFDQNWLTETSTGIIKAIAEGFFDNYTFERDKTRRSILASQLDTIEELLYHFIYMEDCGNDSDHCKSKLVITDEGTDMQNSISCTNLDELYDVIDMYINRMNLNFTFNFCHSYHLDEELKEVDN